jgi:hypothetical protein
MCAFGRGKAAIGRGNTVKHVKIKNLFFMIFCLAHMKMCNNFTAIKQGCESKRDHGAETRTAA